MKVYIHSSVTGQSRDDLESLLGDTACEIVKALQDLEVDEGSSHSAEVEAGQEDDNQDDEVTDEAPVAPVCVVVLTPGLAEAELEPELTEAVRRGCRIIGVWGLGTDGSASLLGDYGADTVPWERDRVRDAICRAPQHQAPSGTRMPKPKGTHGGC